MSNDLTAFNPEYWANEMQEVFFKENVAIKIANTDLRSLLNDGDTVNRPYRSKPRTQTYTKGTDITAKDRSGTNETLVVDTAKVAPFYVDDLDAIQNKWDSASLFAKDCMRQLNNVLDQVVSGEYSNAGDDLFSDDVGGSGATTPIAITTSNIQQVFTAAGRKLDMEDVPQDQRFALIGPHMLETLRLYIGGRDTDYADAVGRNGMVMERFGFKIYYSNNVAFSATWTPANNPTDGDTVSIAGVTFTFKATPALAGAVDIGSDTAGSIANLVAAIMDTGTVGTTYIALSDENRWKIEKSGIVATDGTTVMTIVGYGDISVAASEAADPWSVQVQHSLFGRVGATDLVVQKSPSIVFRDAEKRLGKYVYPWMLYGKKTFYEYKRQLLDVNIDASSF